MLIGGDDIHNDTLPFARSFTSFSKLVYICARFRFALIGGNLTAQWKKSHRKIILVGSGDKNAGKYGGGIQILETYFLFPRRQNAPVSLLAG